MRSSRRLLHWILITVLVGIIVGGQTEDLYKILGVKKTATTNEIKKAYRRKALDTHPDKNKGKDPEVAAEEFRKVVHAFEILSDENSRRHYDRTGRTDSGGGGSPFSSRGGTGTGGTWQFTWTWNTQRRPVRLKDHFDVQKAQSRVIHVVSMEQLKTIMLDDNDLLERNLLMCFVTHGKVQEAAEDDIVFPYPFAGMSTQGIWWEDMLQTVQIKFHRSSELSRFFGVPDADKVSYPIFLFGRRGQPLTNTFPRLATKDRTAFEKWVWQQIEVAVQFVNRHPHPVEIYWIHHTRATLKMTLQPGQSETHTSMLTHEFWVRDARVDTRPDSPGRWKLTDDSSLGSWKITNDTSPQQIIIAAKTCYDLSGHCGFWRSQGECRRNPIFMQESCRKTCKVCTDETTSDGKEDEL